MLGLLAPTDPTWLEAVENDLDTLLADHAHCELKAAQSALSMLARFGGEAPELVDSLLALAKEETAHFDQVHERIRARGGQMELPNSDVYVTKLRRAAKIDHGKYPLLMDRLLINALIEGRSCERFRLLSEGLKSAELRNFYSGLMKSEARHFRLFTEHCDKRFGRGLTRERFRALSEREAAIAEELPLGPRVHG